MAKEFEGYARECVLLARVADSVELLDQPIQLLRMRESSSEPRSSIGADEEEDAANDRDHALDVQERRHRRASRREAEIFLQAMLEEQQGDDDTQNTQDVGPSLFEVCME